MVDVDRPAARARGVARAAARLAPARRASWRARTPSRTSSPPRRARGSWWRWPRRGSSRRQRWDMRAQGYDLVVVDAPASGHGLGMLARRGRSPTSRASGRSPARRPACASCSRTRGAAATSPSRCPGEMPVSETLELERMLREELGRRVEAIVVNGVMPRRFSSADLELIEALDGASPSPVARAARAQAARVRVQQGQLQRLRRHRRPGRDAAVRVRRPPGARGRAGDGRGAGAAVVGRGSSRGRRDELRQ